ncbi:hypothetical protein F0562_006188 [Nyssa sinensis]|uniref:SEC63 domain-containing protein n=1 Tax=Nyssa sinensis TaxID=561372 RepID=A0A5J5AMK5_9ASTE|nr:hypothetical protein F0562_006188 [Nyssa sinensis]
MESAHEKLQNAPNVRRRERVQLRAMRVEDEEPYGTGFDEEDDRDSVVDNRRHEVLPLGNRVLPSRWTSHKCPDPSPSPPTPVTFLKITLERDLEEKRQVGPVDAPRYPKAKEEGWWLVVGDTKSNQLLAIKRVSLQRRSKVKLEFATPREPGKKTCTLYFICDSYIGWDQEYSFIVDIREAGALEDDNGRE